MSGLSEPESPFKPRQENKNNPLFSNTDKEDAEKNVSDLFNGLKNEMEKLNPADFYADYHGGTAIETAIDNTAREAEKTVEDSKQLTAETLPTSSKPA